MEIRSRRTSVGTYVNILLNDNGKCSQSHCLNVNTAKTSKEHLKANWLTQLKGSNNKDAMPCNQMLEDFQLAKQHICTDEY